MKMFSRWFLAGSLATMLFLSYGLAQADMSMKGGCNYDSMGGHGQWKPGDRMEFLKKKLGLTDDQVKRLKEAFKSSMEANKPLMDQQKIDMDMLQQKVDAKASDSDIKMLLDKLKADHKALQEARESVMDKIQEILSPTQQAQMLLMRRQKPMWRKNDHAMNKKWMHHRGKKTEQATPDTNSDASTAE